MQFQQETTLFVAQHTLIAELCCDVFFLVALGSTTFPTFEDKTQISFVQTYPIYPLVMTNIAMENAGPNRNRCFTYY